MTSTFAPWVRRLATCAVVVAGIAAPALGKAEAWTPVQLALWNPAQIFDRETSVAGFRLSLFSGVNEDVTGADVVVWHASTRGDFLGAQLGGFAGHVDGDLTGVQHSWTGVVDGRMRGLQLNGGSYAGDGVGAQVGMASAAKKFRGLQLGVLFNSAEELSGLQLGLVCIAKDGFLPVFPLVNFSL